MFDLLGSINNTDIAYQWIKVLFQNKPEQPLGLAFQVFSNALAFLGSLFMGWHIIVGIVSSAYSGKVLGERWHQIWAPLRVVLGFGLLIPVTNGFSSVHYLLQNVIGVAAVNLGNAPIVAYIDGATSRTTGSKLYSTGGADLVREVMNREVCYAVVKQLNAQRYGVVKVKARVQRPDEGGQDTNWLNDNVQTWDYGACGSISFTKPEVGSSDVLKDASSILDDFQKTRVTAVTTLVKAVRETSFIDYTKLAAFVSANANWDPGSDAAADIVERLKTEDTLPKNLVAQSIDIAQAFDTTMSAAAQKVFGETATKNANILKSRILDYGFMAAGSYERSLSAVAGLAVGLANDPPAVTKIDVTEKYKEIVAKSIALVAGSRVSDNQLALASGMAEPADESGWLTYLIGKIFGPNITNMKLQKDSKDPIGDMITFGHSMLGIASIGITAMSLAMGASSLLGATGIGKVATGIIDYLGQWIGYVIMICLIVGLVHSLVLPMLPMMMVFVMGVSWLVLYLEAAIAGILWSFAFIRMDGNEFFDKNQAPGVTLLFNLLCRPAIGMLAYCGMLLLLPELLRSLAMIWDQSYALQTGNMGWLSLWQWLGGIVLFTWMQWHLTMRLTGLIPTIADRVGHWMGFSGMHGYNDGQETSAAVGAMVAAGMAASKAPIIPQGRPGGGRVQQQQPDNKDNDGGKDGGGSPTGGKDGGGEEAAGGSSGGQTSGGDGGHRGITGESESDSSGPKTSGGTPEGDSRTQGPKTMLPRPDQRDPDAN
jgi:conjugal transfer/type IV secretion protein DotA/TraY